MTDEMRTVVTTDKAVYNRSSKVLTDANGLVHYSVFVDNVPMTVRERAPWLPEQFIVKMCDLMRAYDASTSWYDFSYPTWYLGPESEYDGVPTCIACCGA